MSENKKKIPIKIKFKNTEATAVDRDSTGEKPKPHTDANPHEVEKSNYTKPAYTDGQARPYNNGGGQGRPFNNNGGGQGRPFNNNGGGQDRPFNNNGGGQGRQFNNNGGGQGRQFNNNGGGQGRQFNNNGGGQDRPFNNNGGGQGRPFNNNGGGQGRPFNNNGGGQGRPFNNNGGGQGYYTDGQARPYNNGGGGRPFNNNGGGQGRPFNNNGGGQGRPFNNNGGGQGRPFNNNGGGQGRPFNNNGGGQGRPFNNNRPGGGFNKPTAKEHIGPENSKKDFLSTGNKARTVKSDFKKKKDFTNSYIDKEVSFDLYAPRNKKKSSAAAIPLEIDIYDTILVSELAAKMNLKASDLLSKLIGMGYIATINDALDADTAEIIASEFGCHVNIKSYQDELNELLIGLSTIKAESVTRPPVVTIMGHVDHGKTTLLDYIRNEHVAAGEAGGITQHIGAYQIDHNGKKITFIDTPGHEAFTAMRSRGASITDIVVLVVAADDGIMPQTIEALNHAKVAGVPTIVAINKIDKEIKNIEGIKSQLSEHGLIPEEWGGETMFIGVSALKGTGVTELLDAILLNAEIKDLKANPEMLSRAIILESKIDKSRGSIATVIVQDGTLKKGDIFVSGIAINRVRAMFDHNGNPIEQATPSAPVELLGFEDIPEAGDLIYVADSEKAAKTVVEKKKTIRIAEHAKKITKSDNSLDVLFQKIQEQGKVDFNVIVKADVQGTVEAIKGMLTKLSSQIQEVNLKIIHTAVGAITENDVLLASTSGALIVGFNVRVNNDKTNRLAKEKSIEIRRYSIIYEIVNDIKDAIEGILKPEQSEKITGEATVRQIFKIPKIGFIAGCYVTSGVIKINSQVRVIRDGLVEFTGKIITLKRFKEDVKEAGKGFECGIEIAAFKGIKEGDILECFEIEHTSKKLELIDVPVEITPAT